MWCLKLPLGISQCFMFLNLLQLFWLFALSHNVIQRNCSIRGLSWSINMSGMEIYFYEDCRITSHIQEWKLRTIKLICVLIICILQGNNLLKHKMKLIHSYISQKVSKFCASEKTFLGDFYLFFIFYWALVFFTNIWRENSYSMCSIFHIRDYAVLIWFNKNANTKSNYICLYSFDC